METKDVKEIEKEAFYCANISNLDIIETAEKYAYHCYSGYSTKKKVLNFINAMEFEKEAFTFYGYIPKKEIKIPTDAIVANHNFENIAITLYVNKDIQNKLKNRKHFKDHKNLLICNKK